MIYLLILSALLFPAQRPPQRRPPEIAVPQGWAVEFNFGIDLWVKHSSGASVRVIRSRRAEDLRAFAEREAEGLAYPLGFAEIDTPLHFDDAKGESFEYKIRGNRLAEHRRILYRAIRDPNNSTGVIQIIYENSEDRFDVLMTEAQSIATRFLSQ
jgi:hypothetical protein